MLFGFSSAAVLAMAVEMLIEVALMLMQIYLRRENWFHSDARLQGSHD